MGLFICEECKCIENTATGQYWSVGLKEPIFPDNRCLCSECACTEFVDGTPTGKNGKWHGKFKKMLATNAINAVDNQDLLISQITNYDKMKDKL